MINDKKFNRAIERVLANEGGYSNDQFDAGGETKFGICKRSYPKLDIKNLTIDDAELIYYRDFWQPHLYSELTSFELAEKVFDLAVNVGSSKAHLLLQRALRAVGNAGGQPLKEDGVLGRITLAAVNASNPNELLAALRSEAAGYYRNIVTKNSSQNKFINGWLKRAYS
jgi:lysozyme family protein